MWRRESENQRPGVRSSLCHAARNSKRFVQSHVNPIATVLVAKNRDRGPLIQLILKFDQLILCRVHIGADGQEQAASDALLNGDLRTRVAALAVGGEWIDG